MGSTQKPLERPYVVRTIWSPCLARTKQRPCCPSRSVQKCGHTSHWTRPSSSACQYRVGTIGPALHCETSLICICLFIASSPVRAEVRFSPPRRVFRNREARRDGRQ